MLGYRELLVIFLIVLLVFGGRKIPEIARGLGKGLREFRKARDEIRDAMEEEAGDARGDAAAETSRGGPEPATPTPSEKT